MAREQLEAARATLAAGFPSSAASLAYYAMLYAARAALSEEEKNAKTHRGTWDLFRGTFVEPGRFDRELFDRARRAQRVREGVDYDARRAAPAEAQELVALAELVIAAVTELFA